MRWMLLRDMLGVSPAGHSVWGSRQESRRAGAVVTWKYCLFLKFAAAASGAYDTKQMTVTAKD
ncbi:hypothetical protein XH99_13050 [Bradyrhizobium nanningense]|uniref:Uncharacterized protein n=1 Tax=Bradyrhizobium nanningense TaxID=1325118 RepID=A0A4Q0S6Q1_9BRAD|nr:hypothetical protein XH99_13050 [Bradyrhizobium nanningense]